MAELTSAGLTIRTQAEILAEIEADQTANVSGGLDLSTSSPFGQINRLMARALRIEEEALQALNAAIDPDGATGDALLRLCALTGTIREPATASRVTAVLDLDAGSYLAGTLMAAPAGRPEDTFVNAEDVTSAGGATSVIMVAETVGPINVGADLLTIAGPVAGWNAITSHPAVTPGNAIETEPALRARRTAEVERAGSSSVGGIAADLTANVPLLESVTVIHNATDATVDSIPPHSIEVIAFGPESPTTADDDAVAEQILASVAAGIGTYGTTSRTVLDSQEQSHVIRFTRPADVPVQASAVLVIDPDTYPGDVAARTHITDRAAAVLVPGLDASWDQIVEWAREVPGVYRVTTAGVAILPAGISPLGTATITTRQRATLSLASTYITSASGTP